MIEVLYLAAAFSLIIAALSFYNWTDVERGHLEMRHKEFEQSLKEFEKESKDNEDDDGESWKKG